MSLSDKKLDEILNNAKRLIEQHNQYKKIVHDLSERVKKLEHENKTLHEQLSDIQENQGPASVDKEKLKEQIDKYLHDIDLSIQWLSDLE